MGLIYRLPLIQQIKGLLQSADPAAIDYKNFMSAVRTHAPDMYQEIFPAVKPHELAEVDKKFTDTAQVASPLSSSSLPIIHALSESMNNKQNPEKVKEATSKVAHKPPSK